MLLYYRFSSEHADSYRQCALSSSALSLGETKQLLANHCGLSGEYLRKIDFRIFLAGEKKKSQSDAGTSGGGSGIAEEDLVEVVDEHQMIHAYSHLVVQRVGLVGERVGGVYVHTLAKRQLSKEAWRSDEESHSQRTAKKKRVPPEWLCGLCGGVMTQPVLVKCLGSCTQSACRSCLEAALRAARGACPFCAAAFRQVIRNKRLEEIINHANLQEFEIPPALVATTQQKAISRPAAVREQGRKGRPGDEGARAGGAGGVGIESSSSSSTEDGPSKSGGNAALLLQQTAIGRRERVGTGPNAQIKAVSGAAEQGVPGECPHHFVYLVSQKNLQLMRARDMMLVDESSALAAALAAGSSSLQNVGDAVTTDSRSGAASDCAAAADHCATSDSLPSGHNSESEADLEGRDAFLVSLCASGGGTSFCVGGFVRINSHNRVEISTDRVAQSVVRQWQQVSAAQKGGGGEDANSANILVYRVNWLEKYGIMPMLPSRKQPLGGLVGSSRRTAPASFVIGSNNSGSNFPAGLVQRTFLSFGTLEIVVAPSKYEDVLASVRDYAQFGSRPTDPWQYPGSSSTAAAGPLSAAAGGSAPASADAANSAPSSQAALPAPSHRSAQTSAGVDTKDRSVGTEIYRPPVPPPPPPLPPGTTPFPAYHDRGHFSGEASTTVVLSGESATFSVGTPAAFGGATTFGGTAAVGASAAGSITQAVTRPEGDDELHTGIPASLGPPPLDLYGGPGEEANPYLGYCAILPFLTEEQFWHIQRMQKKAIRLCGYKRPICRGSMSSSSSTSSSSTSSRESRQRRRSGRRPYRRKRHRVLSTESSTGSDSRYDSTDNEEQTRGQRESAHNRRSTSRSSEMISREGATVGMVVTARPPVSVASVEITATSQWLRESKVEGSKAVDQDITDRSDVSSVQQPGNAPSSTNDTLNLAKNARTRSVAGKPLPFVPPPLSTKHAENNGLPTTGAATAKAREDISPTLRPVKSEP